MAQLKAKDEKIIELSADMVKAKELSDSKDQVIAGLKSKPHNRNEALQTMQTKHDKEMDKVKQKLTESRQLVLKERGVSEKRLLELDTEICWRGQCIKVLEAEVEARGRRICELEPKADASSGVDLPGPEQVLAADASSDVDLPGPEQVLAADASSGVDLPGPEQAVFNHSEAMGAGMNTRERNFCFVYYGDRMHYPDFNELNFFRVEGCCDIDGERKIQYVRIQLHANNTRLKSSIPKIIEQYNRMDERTETITPVVFFPLFQTSPIVCFGTKTDIRDNPILKHIAQHKEGSYWRWVSKSSKRGPGSFFPSEPQLP